MISTKKKTISRIRRSTILAERERAMVVGGRWLMNKWGRLGRPRGFIDYLGSLGIPERPFVRSRHVDRKAECRGEQTGRRSWW